MRGAVKLGQYLAMLKYFAKNLEGDDVETLEKIIQGLEEALSDILEECERVRRWGGGSWSRGSAGRERRSSRYGYSSYKRM